MIFSRHAAFISLVILSLASADVSCGGHSAASCERCPHRPDGDFVGPGWCNGDCEWIDPSNSDDSTNCVAKAWRNWDPALLLASVGAAADFCADPNPDAAAEKYATAARDLYVVLQFYEIYHADDSLTSPDVETVAAEAATIAQDLLTPDSNGGETCAARATGCNRGMVLLHQLRNLLALHGVDPFPDSAPHGALFAEHGVLVADGLFMNAETLEVVHTYYDTVPAHLMIEGVRKNAAYATMSVKDEFKCDGVAEEIRLSVTKRGFNVFRNQVGDSRENAFGETSFGFVGDLLMTATRHEVAHQFDRVVQADDDLWGMMQAYIAQATTALDWLRNSVGNDFFQTNQVEIIASQVGNQYTLSSANQLALALDRLATQTSALPLAWFLLHVDLFSRGPAACADRACRTRSSLYHAGVDVGGTTSTYCAEVGRDPTTGRITSLGLPGCPVLGVTWSDVGGAGALPVAVTPADWSCAPAWDAGDAACGDAAPTPPDTSTMSPTATSTAAPSTSTSTDVSCGGHFAPSCAECPLDSDGGNHGRGWCNGECAWNDGIDMCDAKPAPTTLPTLGPTAKPTLPPMTNPAPTPPNPAPTPTQGIPDDVTLLLAAPCYRQVNLSNHPDRFKCALQQTTAHAAPDCYGNNPVALRGTGGCVIEVQPVTWAWGGFDFIFQTSESIDTVKACFLPGTLLVESGPRAL